MRQMRQKLGKPSTECRAESAKPYSNQGPQACSISPSVGLAETALNMSNSPTLPPPAEPQRKPTPLPVLAHESDTRLQAALAASARADASLNGLFRAIQQLGSGLGGAREANESLTLELEGLRDLLGVASERQQIFERKLAELELVLDRTRK